MDISMVPRPATFDDLEDAILEVIFQFACAAPVTRSICSFDSSIGSNSVGAAGSACRHNPAIPQVCRRWADVYTTSALLWEEIWIDWGALARQTGETSSLQFQPDLPPAFSAGARWLAARLPYARRLVFAGCAALAPPAEPLPLAQLFPAGLSSPRLAEARFWGAWGASGASLLSLLRSCPVLQSVTLACMTHAKGKQTALEAHARVLSGLASLPALASLSLHVDKLAGNTAELAAALPGLTHLSVRCRMESAALAPELLEGLSQLRRLELDNVRLAQFTPRLAQSLSQLTHLACSDVLAAQPRRRAGIQLWQGLRHLASLRELRLERQGGAGMPANALACRGLRGLTLLSCEAREWPAAPFHYTGEGGCVGRLASLHLESLHLPGPVPAQLWALLGAGLTTLTWRSVMRSVAQHEAAHAGGALHARMQALEVPAELARLTGLRELRLEYAHLDVVPPAVQALTALTSLSLEGNRISTLPEGAYLTALQRLSLANNALAEGVPEGLTACISLQELSLAGNLLHTSRTAAAALAAALPCLRCLVVRLPPGSLGPPAVRQQPALGQAAGDAAEAGDGMELDQQGVAAAALLPGAALAGHDNQPAAAAAAAAAGAALAAAVGAHIQALGHLAHALGHRMVVEAP